MKFVMPKNRVLQAIQAQKTALGMYMELPACAIVELAAMAGMDFIRFDWCHAGMDLSQLEKCILAAEKNGITPMVRINAGHPDLNRILEMGIMGVIVPDVDSAEKAREAVRAIKFAPIGDRGLFSAARQAGYGAISGKEYVEWTNQNVLIGVQIESREGMACLDQILEVDGIDMVLSGRGDLSNSLGVPGQKNHPDVLAAEQEIFTKAKSKGKCISPQEEFGAKDLANRLRRWNQQGAYAVSLGLDVAIVKNAFSTLMERAKAEE